MLEKEQLKMVDSDKLENTLFKERHLRQKQWVSLGNVGTSLPSAGRRSRCLDV